MVGKLKDIPNNDIQSYPVYELLVESLDTISLEPNHQHSVIVPKVLSQEIKLYLFKI